MFFKKNNNFYILISLLSFSFINLFGMQSVFNTDFFQYKAPDKYKISNFKIIPPVFIQADNFSCGYRSAFHSIAFERALKSGNFSDNLNRYLSDETLLKSIYKMFSKKNGLTNLDIDIIAKKYGIDSKLIVLNLDKNNRLGYLGKLSIRYSGYLTEDQINQLVQKKKAQLLSEKIESIKNQLMGPNRSGYFVCGHSNHWTLFSIITDNNGYARLYMIDSNIRPIIDKDKIFIDYFSNIVSYLNNRKTNKTSNKKNDSRPVLEKTNKKSQKVSHNKNLNKSKSKIRAAKFFVLRKKR